MDLLRKSNEIERAKQEMNRFPVNFKIETNLDFFL